MWNLAGKTVFQALLLCPNEAIIFRKQLVYGCFFVFLKRNPTDLPRYNPLSEIGGIYFGNSHNNTDLVIFIQKKKEPARLSDASLAAKAECLTDSTVIIAH